ncbi:MAG: cysteine desulfurase [Treponema sp.]|nr:cysteine desulfurase [Treponema sp.]
MADKKVYMDYNATTPLREEVRDAMVRDLEIYGNASSMHSSGRLARSRIEEARSSLGALLGAPPGDLVFGSGGTELNNTVFHTMRRLASEQRPPFQGRSEIITTAIEHPCVLNSAEYSRNQGLKVHLLPVDSAGKIDMEVYRRTLSDKTLFVSVMAANNEIGTIQNMKEITALAKEAGALVHSDGVQAVGKIPINVEDLGLDYLTMSAHKIYGPKGIGALYVKKGAPLYPLLEGGHQEKGLRAGTYNTLGILGLGKAAELALSCLGEYQERTGALKAYLREGLLERIPNITINGHQEDCLPNTLNVSFPGAEGESILLSMDMAGIEVSTGSACASGSLDPSHVLMAIGAGPSLAHGSIRFSLGWYSTREDADYVLEQLPPIISRLRAMSTLGE